mgnify:FL=1
MEMSSQVLPAPAAQGGGNIAKGVGAFFPIAGGVLQVGMAMYNAKKKADHAREQRKKLAQEIKDTQTRLSSGSRMLRNDLSDIGEETSEEVQDAGNEMGEIIEGGNNQIGKIINRTGAISTGSVVGAQDNLEESFERKSAGLLDSVNNNYSQKTAQVLQPYQNNVNQAMSNIQSMNDTYKQYGKQTSATANFFGG